MGHGLSIAVIDGPVDPTVASALARPLEALAAGRCAEEAASECAHGTFVIGLLGARGDGEAPGLCPECRLLHVPLFSGFGRDITVAELARAIDLATAAGADIVNLSLSVIDPALVTHEELRQALDRALGQGVVIVAAAGNGGRFVHGQLLSHPAVVPVAGIRRDGRPMGQSNISPSIGRHGVSAVGEGVLGPAPGGGLVRLSGTSVAAAMATGTIAAAWSRRPDLSPDEIRLAIRALGPRRGLFPPRLDRDALEEALSALRPAGRTASPGFTSRQRRGARPNMEAITADEAVRPPSPAADLPVARLAHGSEGCGCGCGGKGGCSCGGNAEPEAPPAFVYALGSVEVQFPDPSLEQELRDIAAAENVRGQETSPAWLSRVLKKREARYVARQLCYLFTVEGQPVYALRLRDPGDLDLLIEAAGSGASATDLDLVVGVRGPLTSLVSCGSVMVPVVVVDQIASFARAALVERIPVPEGADEQAFRETATAVVARLIQVADNVGATDAHRALNYLAVRYAPIFTLTAELEGRGFQLSAVDVGISRLSGARTIVAPIFTYQNRSSGFVEKYFVRVDVTSEFPTIANHLQPYFDR